MAEFERQPIDLSDIPDTLHKHVEEDASTRLKMMAARGMLPAPPEQMVKVLYQLHFDADATVSEAAGEALAEMPAEVVGPALEQVGHPGLLDWAGQLHRDHPQVCEVVVRHQATADATVARLAEDADRQLADIIATNQVRILGCPAIIEGLYKNAAVSSATIDNLIELARRNDVQLDGLPGLADALESGQPIFGGNDGADEDTFSELLEDEADRAAREDEKRRKLDEQADSLLRSQREKLRDELENDSDDDSQADQGQASRRNMTSKINDMSVAQKIRLATVGSREALKILVRDQNKLVHMAAIKSPRVKTGDIPKFASNKSLPDNVIEYIAGNRDWTRKYEVVNNLVHNPKTPLKDTMKFLKHLRVNDLRDVMRSRDVPHQVTRAAKSLMRKRTGS